MVQKNMAISVRGLCKTFKIYSRPGDIMMEALTGKQRHTVFEALHGIDFKVERGHSVGIMGRNGAGKSTLLKIITGALSQSEGEVIVNGSVAAILELGTGFHPEYTGRDNVYMGGMCLGMSRRQIDHKFDEIVAFAELEDFIDQPFRTYSSGMQARLTFSVALAPDPDILIIDEALSVGDARFQQKCYAHMHKLRDMGKTFLLVSHDEGAIVSFCDQAIILDGGRVVFQGKPQEAGWTYQKLLFGTSAKDDEKGADVIPSAVNSSVEAAEAEYQGADRIDTDQPVEELTVSAEEKSASGSETGTEENKTDEQGVIDVQSLRYGTKRAVITDFGIRNQEGEKCTRLISGQPCSFFMTLRINEAIEGWSGGFAIKDRRGLIVFGITSLSQNMKVPTLTAGEEITCQSDCVMWLAEGTYFLTIGLAEGESGAKIDFIENAVVFNVVGPGGIFTTSYVNLAADFQIRMREKNSIANAITEEPDDENK